MKEVDRSWDMDSEDVYSVNGKKYTARGETVNAPDDIAEAIEASKVEYEQRKVPARETLTPEEIASIVEQVASQIPEGGTDVEANPTLAGTEASLDSIEIDGTKYKNPATDKVDKTEFTFKEAGANLFEIANGKTPWIPSTSSGATYADGTATAGFYTTNLIPYTSNEKLKMNIPFKPSFFKALFYDSEQAFISNTTQLKIDDDLVYYIQQKVTNVAYVAFCFNFSAGQWENLYIARYDTYGERTAEVKDLHLSAKNAENARQSMGVAKDVLYGKKWAVAGDSFTSGGWSSGTEPTIEDGRYKGEVAVYPYLIANRNNMIIDKHFKGGRTLAQPASGNFSNSFINDYQNVASNADYLTIYLGINDSHHRPDATGSDGEDTTGEIPLGEITDNVSSSFYGAWNVILSWLIENRPNLKIGIIVSNGCETDDYRTATIAIANKYGIPYIDLNGDRFTPCMIRSTNTDVASAVKTQRNANWVIANNNAHPNEACHKFEATIIENFLRSL